MCNDKNMFDELRNSTQKTSVSVGDGKLSEVSGIGTATSVVVQDGTKSVVQLREVLHLPDLICNLTSVSRMRKAGQSIV